MCWIRTYICVCGLWNGKKPAFVICSLQIGRRFPKYLCWMGEDAAFIVKIREQISLCAPTDCI